MLLLFMPVCQKCLRAWLSTEAGSRNFSSDYIVTVRITYFVVRWAPLVIKGQEKSPALFHITANATPVIRRVNDRNMSVDTGQTRLELIGWA